MSAPDYPVLEWAKGEPIPDLRAFAPEHWFAALAPLSRGIRERAFLLAGATLDESAELMWRLDERDYELRQATLRATAPGESPLEPRVALRAAVAREASRASRSRQLNFRLGPGEYSELEKVAASIGLKPAQLARQLVLNGMRRVRYEQRALERRADGDA